MEKLKAYERTSMVRIPTQTRNALQQLSKDRDLDESLGQLITILQREATAKIAKPTPLDEDTVRAVLAKLADEANIEKSE